ncbi:MAG TPA: hypothetical protein VFJ24_03560 [Gaiellales bacterium]|nr:hypothetical protein [Gaiellales bacterium]
MRTPPLGLSHRERGSLMWAWPLERVLFALAGTVTLVSAVLAATVSPWFLLLTAFVGVNQWLDVAVGACPASVVLRRACHLRSAIDDAPGHLKDAKV